VALLGGMNDCYGGRVNLDCECICYRDLFSGAQCTGTMNKICTCIGHGIITCSNKFN